MNVNSDPRNFYMSFFNITLHMAGRVRLRNKTPVIHIHGPFSEK